MTDRTRMSARALADVVERCIAQALKPLADRVRALEQRAAVPGPPGPPGPRGRPGTDGADGRDWTPASSTESSSETLRADAADAPVH